MNWDNLDLTENSHERDARLIDGLTFDALLLEINCNIKEINEKTVKFQFIKDMQYRLEEAQSIFNANLTNIVKQAKKERNRK